VEELKDSSKKEKRIWEHLGKRIEDIKKECIPIRPHSILV